jgi:hypothetical protein
MNYLYIYVLLHSRVDLETAEHMKYEIDVYTSFLWASFFETLTLGVVTSQFWTHLLSFWNKFEFLIQVETG